MGIPTRQEFLAYAEYEPRLLKLEERIKAHSAENASRRRRYCANNAWTGRDGFKLEMMLLAGWKSNVPELNNSAAYDTVYHYLYNLLPDCRHESGAYGCFARV